MCLISATIGATPLAKNTYCIGDQETTNVGQVYGKSGADNIIAALE